MYFKRKPKTILEKTVVKTTPTKRPSYEFDTFNRFPVKTKSGLLTRRSFKIKKSSAKQDVGFRESSFVKPIKYFNYPNPVFKGVRSIAVRKKVGKREMRSINRSFERKKINSKFN